jgi:hypothetical protein
MVQYSEYGVSVLNVLVPVQFRQNMAVLKLSTRREQKIFTPPKRLYPLCGPSASYSMGTGFISCG